MSMQNPGQSQGPLLIQRSNTKEFMSGTFAAGGSSSNHNSNKLTGGNSQTQMINDNDDLNDGGLKEFDLELQEAENIQNNNNSKSSVIDTKAKLRYQGLLLHYFI